MRTLSAFGLRAGLLGALGAALLWLAGCVPTSENPITRPGQLPDKDLVGAWHGKLDDGGRIDLYFLGRQDKQHLSAVFITTGEGSEDHGEWAVFTVLTGEVKGTRYLSALWDFNDGEAVTGRDHGYHLLRYTIAPDGALAMFGVDEKKLLKAVKRHKLDGTIDDKDKNWPEVRVTASTEKLAAYLETIDPTKLFDKPFAQLTRGPAK